MLLTPEMNSDDPNIPDGLCHCGCGMPTKIVAGRHLMYFNRSHHPEARKKADNEKKKQRMQRDKKADNEKKKQRMQRDKTWRLENEEKFKFQVRQRMNEVAQKVAALEATSYVPHFFYAFTQQGNIKIGHTSVVRLTD